MLVLKEYPKCMRKEKGRRWKKSIHPKAPLINNGTDLIISE